MYGELHPLGGGDPIPLLKNQLLMGRRESCDIVLRFPNVSAHHCQLTLNNGYWYVKDLGSANGVKVNGQRISMLEKLVEPGDQLAVAKHNYEIKYSPYDLGAIGPPPADDADLPQQIFGKSLLERAGLAKPAPSSSGSSSGRYDPTKDKGGNFRDPNRLV
jgi:predicted component of type VI protein secretion system